MNRYLEQIVPAAAVGVPKEILEASEALRLAGDAEEDARRRLKEAREAARLAPAVDAEAAVEAVRRGEDPPPATSRTREAEAQTARERLMASEKIAEQAAKRLERMYREHRASWIEAQRRDAAEKIAEALAAADAFEEIAMRADVSARIVATMQTAPIESRVIERCRRFNVGPRAASFTRTLAQVRQDIANAMPAALPTPAEVAAKEDADEVRRRWAKLGRSAVING